MVNVPLSAQPFVRNADSGYSSSGSIKEVSGIKACFRVTDPYIINEISFTVSYVSSNNQMELMQAYETGVQIMQLCQQIKQGGMQNMNNGYGQTMNNGYGQPMQQGYVQQNFQQPMQQNGYAQQNFQQSMPQNGYAQQPMQQGYVQQQPVQNGSWFCPNCGTQNTSKFCSGCGTPKQ